MLRKIVRYLFYGISWGCTFFVLTCLVGSLCTGGAFLQPIFEDFVRQAVGAMLVGVCCGSSSIVYTFKKLPFSAQVAIHAGVGLTGYFAASYFLGWMPRENWGQMLCYALLGLLIFFLIWLGFYLHNRREAKRMNARLRQLQGEEKEK